MSPTARTLKALRADGWLADEVERRITRTVSRDWLGVVDILAIREGQWLAVQATSGDGGNVAARLRKCRNHENTPKIQKAARFVVHGWRYRKLKGQRSGEWICREVEV